MSRFNRKKGRASKASSSTKGSKNHSGGKKVFLTGISGFIASELAERLHAEGYKVSGLVRKSSRPSPAVERLRGKVDFYEGDLTDFSGISAVLRAAAPDIILHFGAITPVSYSFDHPQEVTQVNYLGTMNLAEAARREVPHLELFAFSSSMEVYGVQEERPFHENIAPRPNCPYAVAKLAAEKYLEYMWRAYKFPAISIRQTNCYGRKDNNYFIVEAVLTQMLQNRHGAINLGRKEPVRNFIHIQDLTDFYLRVLLSLGGDGLKPFGQIFNVGPANGMTIEKLVRECASITGFKGKTNWNTREIRVGEIFYLNSHAQKALKFFGWEPKIGLRNGLVMTAAHWSKKLKV